VGGETDPLQRSQDNIFNRSTVLWGLLPFDYQPFGLKVEHVVRIKDATAPITLDGIAIFSGRINSTSASITSGAGILIEQQVPGPRAVSANLVQLLA
jgi:hypothetical protein